MCFLEGLGCKKCAALLFFSFFEGNPVDVSYAVCSAAQIITRRFYDSIVEGAHYAARVCVCVSVCVRVCGRQHASNVNSLMEG